MWPQRAQALAATRGGKSVGLGLKAWATILGPYKEGLSSMTLHAAGCFQVIIRI